MKLTDKQEKSQKYLAAVLQLRDRKDELLTAAADTVSKIATIKAELEGIEPQLIKATDVHVNKALRTKRKDLLESLEDYEAVKPDILGTLMALNSDLQPLRMAAWDELDAFTDAANAEIEAIQEKAREAILDVRDAIDMHPLQLADKTIDNILKLGGWQNKTGGHVSETVKHKPSKDGPDRALNYTGLGEFRKPELTEDGKWGAAARMFCDKPGQ